MPEPTRTTPEIHEGAHDDDTRIMLRLSEDTAEWLFDLVGARPHDELESREVWDELRSQLRGDD